MSGSVAAYRQEELASTSSIPWRRWLAFLFGGLVVYLAFYAWSEFLVYKHADQNRFHLISSTPPQRFDFAILGASHAMPLSYGDSHQQLEAKTGASIMNLSSEGAGILPNRLLLDYFLSRHSASHVVYVIDEFAFYSAHWNEDRLDASTLNRAPLDLDIARTLWKYPWSRHLLPIYLSGFGKINNSERFSDDVAAGELKFESTYSPIAQVDRRRVQYLFPESDLDSIFPKYRDEFRSLVELVLARGMEMTVILPPTPPRYRDNLPDVSKFKEAMAELKEYGRITYHDFSSTVVADEYFFDTDHLNIHGVDKFVNDIFADTLKNALRQ